MWRWYFAVCLFLFSESVLSQECPRFDPAGPDVPSAVQQVQGTLVYHDDLRQWFELKLDTQKCGQSSLQLVRTDDRWKQLEVLRGCHVRSRGKLGDSGTGYYSLDVYQAVEYIERDKICTLKPTLPDFSRSKPDPQVKNYLVEMTINYRPGEHPVIFKVTAGGRTLHPWQAYASYDLTGGFVLYGNCARGFGVHSVSGTQEAKPTFMSDEEPATFDPESASAVGIYDLRLSYTCFHTK